MSTANATASAGFGLRIAALTKEPMMFVLLKMGGLAQILTARSRPKPIQMDPDTTR
jgi:hypothetical protein